MISEWKKPVGGCVGLCAGDGCEKCVRLADQITFAKRQRAGAFRTEWPRFLGDRVADVMGVRRG